VAVIGSGASAIQFVPAIAGQVRRLHHFQRQPQWVVPKVDDPYTAEEIAQFVADPTISHKMRLDFLSLIDKGLLFSDPGVRRESEKLGLENLALVEDPDTRRLLAPVGPYGCHRPLLSNTYYPTFNLPHVEVVRSPIARVTPSGVVTADGHQRNVDTIILGTGFATTKYLSVVDTIGRQGLRLDDAWVDGAEAYLGITTAGFPNLFMLYGPNTNNGTILHMIECQVAYIERHLRRMDDEELGWVDVRPEVMSQYNERLQRDLAAVEVWGADCHGYYRSPSGRIVTQWPHSMSDYADWTSKPDSEAYEVGARTPPSELTLSPGASVWRE
jgi:cyclohexanone monooxygenase